MTHRFVLGIAATLAALAFAPSGVASIGDAATGSGIDSFGGNPFSFAATGGIHGSATGTMQYTEQAGHNVWSATVRCLVVSGNRAIVVGTTVSSSPVLGLDLVFGVEDEGTPGAGLDQFVAGFATGIGSCDSLTTADIVGPITAGEITVVEATAAQKIATLIAELEVSPAGPGGSYLAKLESIAASLGTGNGQTACNQLSAFESEVRAQTGKKLSQSEADDLLAATASIKAQAGCP
jgi:hypothetical protein